MRDQGHILNADFEAQLPAGNDGSLEAEENDFLELPMHSFKKGDPVIFRHAKHDGDIPELQVSLVTIPIASLKLHVMSSCLRSLTLSSMVQADIQPLQAALISVARNFLKVAVTTEVHKELLEAPEGKEMLRNLFHL